MSWKSRVYRLGFASIAALAAHSNARADPCKAIPDRGVFPVYLHRGAAFSGLVV
jgi:hypothetical protein